MEGSGPRCSIVFLLRDLVSFPEPTRLHFNGFHHTVESQETSLQTLSLPDIKTRVKGKINTVWPCTTKWALSENNTLFQALHVQLS